MGRVFGCLARRSTRGNRRANLGKWGALSTEAGTFVCAPISRFQQPQLALLKLLLRDISSCFSSFCFAIKRKALEDPDSVVLAIGASRFEGHHKQFRLRYHLVNAHSTEKALTCPTFNLILPHPILPHSSSSSTTNPFSFNHSLLGL